MRAFGILLRKEFAESWRTRRAPVVLGLFFVMGMLAPLLARFTPDIVAASGGPNLAAALPTPTAGDAVDQFLKTVGQFGAFVAILLAMGSVASDRERGTAALVLTKPVGRGVYLAAKLVTLAALLGAASAVAGITAATYTAVLFEPLPLPGFAGAVALVWVGLLVPAAITFLGSVLGRSPAAAAGLGFAWVVLGGVSAALPVIGPDMPGSLTGQARALALGVGAGPSAASVAAPLLVSIVVLGASVAIAWRTVARQEL
jgi:ABC-2 type transport system permease protein